MTVTHTQITNKLCKQLPTDSQQSRCAADTMRITCVWELLAIQQQLFWVTFSNDSFLSPQLESQIGASLSPTSI